MIEVMKKNYNFSFYAHYKYELFIYKKSHVDILK